MYEQKARSGYDIRTDILMMAKELVMKEFESDFRIYELYHMINSNDSRFEEVPSKPPFPTIDKIVDIANKMNEFVVKK